MRDIIKSLKKIKNVSKFSSRKDWEKAAWDCIIATLHKSQSKKDAALFLALIISEPERRNIIKRATAIIKLIEGNSYRNIGKELWLSPQTISAIRKGIDEKGYVSRWTRDSHRDRERKRRKNLDRIAKREAREAKIRPTRRTKYGRLPYI
jgi:Trp operon repressor